MLPEALISCFAVLDKRSAWLLRFNIDRFCRLVLPFRHNFSSISINFAKLVIIIHEKSFILAASETYFSRNDFVLICIICPILKKGLYLLFFVHFSFAHFSFEIYNLTY